MTFIKQVKEISLQYQTDLRDANIAEVRASVQHLDGRYFNQELAIKFDKPLQATQPGDAEDWDEAIVRHIKVENNKISQCKQ